MNIAATTAPVAVLAEAGCGLEVGDAGGVFLLEGGEGCGAVGATGAAFLGVGFYGGVGEEGGGDEEGCHFFLCVMCDRWGGVGEGDVGRLIWFWGLGFRWEVIL